MAHVQVEQQGGEDSTLRDSLTYLSRFGELASEEGPGAAAAEVGEDPPFQNIGETRVQNIC